MEDGAQGVEHGMGNGAWSMDRRARQRARLPHGAGEHRVNWSNSAAGEHGARRTAHSARQRARRRAYGAGERRVNWSNREPLFDQFE